MSSGSRPVTRSSSAAAESAGGRRSCRASRWWPVWCWACSPAVCSGADDGTPPWPPACGGDIVVSNAAAAASPVATSAAEPAQMAALDRALVHGIAWTGTLKWGSQLVAWLATLVVARTLTPTDYGLFAMASMFLGLVAVLSEFGIGTAVVTLRDLADEELAQINSLAILFGLAAFAISSAAAVPLARFFAAPELPPIVIALS